MIFQALQKSFRDFIPLVSAEFMLLAGYIIEIKNPEQIAFYVGAFVFLVQLIYYKLKGIKLDSLALGSDIFLVIGAFIGALIGTMPYISIIEPLFVFSSSGYQTVYRSVQVPYASLRYTSSIFMYITLVGLILSLISKEGFLQVDGPRGKVVKGSLILVGCSFVIWLLLALFSATGRFLGLLLPLEVLIVLRENLRDKIKKGS